MENYDSILERAFEYGKSQHPDAPAEHHAAFACHHHQKCLAISLQLYFHFARRLNFIQSSFSFQRITNS